MLAIFSRIIVRANDFNRRIAFYDAALAPRNPRLERRAHGEGSRLGEGRCDLLTSVSLPGRMRQRLPLRQPSEVSTLPSDEFLRHSFQTAAKR